MTNNELIDKIFKDPNVRYELSEFDNLNYDTVFEVITEYGTGKNSGKKIYFIKTLAPFHSENEKVQIYVEDGKSNPEEIVRQLWVHKLINTYGYSKDEIELEKPITFGGDTGSKFADIIVFTSSAKTTPKIVLEIKKPKRKDGIEQLRSYLNAEGSPIGVWSNGSERVILYRPDRNSDFDALPEIPEKGKTANDIQETRLTLSHLENDFDFKKILLDLEELVLGSSGVNVFNEIFKIIFAKIWDEKQAIETRADQTLEFKWFKDPELTYDRINNLFKKANDEWKGVFEPNDKIKLQKEHLNVCIAPLERKKFLGSNLRIMDDAFEYLLPTEAKKKKGQFFTPRFVIDMCVRMMNPTKTEYVMDPSCGSAGFLVHTMDWAYPAHSVDDMELRKSRYAARYLWGIDFEEQAAKTSRALMLIAGDGHSNIFGPDVDTLESKTWYRTPSGKKLMEKLKEFSLTQEPIPNEELFNDDENAWKYFENLKFDVILSNPPFAGEVKVKEQLKHYELAKPALKRAKDKQAKEERDVLFIERIIKFLKPGGRAAIVLPQGKFNNSSLAFIREWILRKARLLAVVGLHQNSFKPHTGTKTSVLFIQKYTQNELDNIKAIQDRITSECPNYATIIEELLDAHQEVLEIEEDKIPQNILELIGEEFASNEDLNEEDENENEDEEGTTIELDELIEKADEKIDKIRNEILKNKQRLENFEFELSGLEESQKQEIEAISENFEGNKKELNAHLKPIKEAHKEALKELKATQKEQKKKLTNEIKSLEKELPLAQHERRILTNKGKLEIILSDDTLLETLSNRYIDAKVAIELDYPIFMAVSEKGGKNNSGEYEYKIEDGNIVEDSDGNPVFDQDLVNYEISKEQLRDIDTIPENKLCIAEAFIKYAKEQNFEFWR